MENSTENHQNINEHEDETNAVKADTNAKGLRADDAFKTKGKGRGLTWENPMDEQAFDDDTLSNAAKEEGD